MFPGLKNEYNSIKKDIKLRLDDFSAIWEKGSEEDIFYELMFCLMTPQSKAELCWASVKRVREKDIKEIRRSEDLHGDMAGVRFKFKKSEYILEARDKFFREGYFSIKEQIKSFDDVYGIREWLVKEIKGIGYKEAGHFLRNIGFGKEISILDRHILKNLKSFGVLNLIPSSMTKKKYLEIEKKMSRFAEKIDIPLDHLDLLFWYREVGKIFK